jgi:hypothetical protein
MVVRMDGSNPLGVLMLPHAEHQPHVVKRLEKLSVGLRAEVAHGSHTCRIENHQGAKIPNARTLAGIEGPHC